MRALNLIANRCFAYLFSYLVNTRLTDTLCGTKVLMRKDYEVLVRERSYFGNFDPFGDFDLIFGAAKQVPRADRDRPCAVVLELARYRTSLAGPGAPSPLIDRMRPLGRPMSVFHGVGTPVPRMALRVAIAPVAAKLPAAPTRIPFTSIKRPRGVEPDWGGL
jgi:hypothetical protein